MLPQANSQSGPQRQQLEIQRGGFTETKINDLKKKIRPYGLHMFFNSKIFIQTASAWELFKLLVFLKCSQNVILNLINWP